MYLNIGQGYIIHTEDVLGIFDLDITSQSPRTREFLKKAEQSGAVVTLSQDIPKSFLLCDWPDDTTLFLSPINSRVMAGRFEEPLKHFENEN